LEVGSFSYWFDKPQFHTERRIAAVLIIPSSLGFPTGCLTSTIKQLFWRRCREERRFLQGESLASNLFTLLLFCFTLFLLASFYQKYKK
jgi:hypothetical protein